MFSANIYITFFIIYTYEAAKKKYNKIKPAQQ